MVSLNAVDYLILGILVFSALLSLSRGFVKEALSLGNWVCAFIVSQFFSAQFSVLLARLGVLTDSPYRGLVAYAGLFFISFFVGGILVKFLSKLVKETALAPVDRVLGVVFGLLRAVVLITLVVGLMAWAGAEQDQLWQDSKTIGFFADLGAWVRQHLVQMGR